MKIKNEKTLISLMDKKIELLSSYKVVSSEIINSDIEAISEKFAQRQVLINQINDISNKIRDIASEQDEDVKETLNDILAFKDYNPVIEYKEIYQRAIEIKSILMVISHNENKINNHMEELKSLMRDSMKKSVDNKKIVDYYNTVTKKVIHGTKFNTLK